jgi:aminomethyltransferase
MKQTILHNKYLQLNTKMTDQHGWQVPLQFTELQDEYYAVRTAAGLFDVGFLGRIEISGAGATDMLQKIFTRNISKLAAGTSCYGMLCNEAGFIINDGIIFRLNGNRYLYTASSLNAEKAFAWLKQHAGNDVRIEDRTQSMAQFSLQGPLSYRILQSMLTDIKQFKPKSVRELNIADTTVYVSRTGYTGEQGYELFILADHAEAVYDAIMAAGKDIRALRCGFACRDILRMEMGYLLYGNDIDETRNPIEAGLASYIDFKKDFIGKDALQKILAKKNGLKLVGFELADKGIPKAGGSIFSENREIGTVTSGGQSPHVRKSIGLGYVGSRYAQPSQEIEIEVKEHEIAAKIVALPFYRKK